MVAAGSPHQVARKLLTELANACDTDAIQEFVRHWPDFSREAELVVPPAFLADEDEVPEALRHVSFLAYLLRRLWVADDEAVKKLNAIFLTRNLTLTLSPPFFETDWRRGTFAYHPQTEVQRVLHYLLQHVEFVKRCGNVDCARPYFIGNHTADKYCSEKCFAVARKKSKRAWWNEHGGEWRDAAEKVKRKKSRERESKAL